MNNINPFSPQNGVAPINGAMAQAESEKSIEETRAALIIAKKFPRNQEQAYNNIISACRRPALADGGLYEYKRGGQRVCGASIRLAETIAQCWGNMDYGFKEIGQKDGSIEVLVYAWDQENNVRRSMSFTVKNERHTKQGIKALVDVRDVYENMANLGARRLRACILAIVPRDIVEAAEAECMRTMQANMGSNQGESIDKMKAAFNDLGVDQDMIEARIGHPLTSLSANEYMELKRVYQSIKDGMGKKEEYFPIKSLKSNNASSINDALKEV